MKKIFLFLLWLFAFNNAFACLDKAEIDKKKVSLKESINQLVKTRDQWNSNDKEVRAIRQRAENILNDSYNNQGLESRKITESIFFELNDTFNKSLQEHIRDNDGKENLSKDCLSELKRIAIIIGLKFN